MIINVEPRKYEIMIDLRKAMEDRAYTIYKELYKDIDSVNRKRIKNNTLVFEYYSSDDFNGHSEVKDNKDYIMLSDHFVEKYTTLFSEYNQCICNEVLALLYPNQNIEESENNSFEGWIYENGNRRMIDSKVIGEHRTNLMVVFAIRLIILHEMGHIFDGHLDYLNSINGKSLSLYMFGNNDINDALLIRTMEMDADAFAATQSIRYVFYLYDNFEKEVKCAELKKEELFYYWAVAVRLQFIYSEYLTRSVGEPEYYKEMTHLPMNARWIQVVNIATEIVEREINNESLCNKIKDIIINGSYEADRVFNKLYCRPDTNWIENITNTSEFSEYFDETLTYWREELINILRPYARYTLGE